MKPGNRNSGFITTLTTLLGITLCTAILSTQALAATSASTITCTDTKDFSDCQLSDDSDFAAIEPIIELVKDVNNCQTDQVQQTQSATCTTSKNLQIQCSSDQASNQITCQFPYDTSVSCTETGGNAISCTIQSADDNSIAILTNTLGETANSIAIRPRAEMARVLGQVCSSRLANTALQTDCDALFTLARSTNPTDLALAAKILEELTPSFASVSVDAAVGAANAQDQNVQKRLRAIRSNRSDDAESAMANSLRKILASYQGGGNSPNTQGFTDVFAGGNAGDEDLSTPFSKLGGFVNTTLLTADKDPTALERESDTDTVALTIGVDYQFNRQLVTGLALGLTTTNTDVNSINGEFEVEGYTMAFYGSYYPTDSIYLDYTLGYTGNEYDQSRDIVYTLVNQTATAEYNGSLTSASVGGGYLWNRNALSIDGFGQLIHLTANVGSYEEEMSGTELGSGWGLAIASQELTSLTLHLGAQANYVFNQTWGVITPLARVEFISELDDDVRIITGNFVGDLSDRFAFSLLTDEVDTSYMNMGVGVSAVTKGGKSFYAYYQSLLGYDDVSQNQINLGARVEF